MWISNAHHLVLPTLLRTSAQEAMEVTFCGRPEAARLPILSVKCITLPDELLGI
jgi:hypothetical protein